MKRLLALLLLLAVPLSPAWSQHVVNLRDADIRAFIEDAARVTGRTFIVDGAVQGKVSVVTQRPLSRSEYFELFLSTLRANGLVAGQGAGVDQPPPSRLELFQPLPSSPRGNGLVAVPLAGGAFRIQPVAGAASTRGRSGVRGSPNAFVTEIFRLRHIDAAAAIEALKPLVSKEGSITGSRTSVVVADFADNVVRIRRLLASIDRDTTSSRIVSLHNAGAREIATALSALSGEDGGVTIVPVDSSNALALRGDATAVARLASMAAELDARAASGTEIRVMFLEHADAAQLLPVLQQLLGQPVTPPPSTTGLSRESNDQAGMASRGRAAAQTTVTTSAAPASTEPAGPGIFGPRGAVVTR